MGVSEKETEAEVRRFFLWWILSSVAVASIELPDDRTIECEETNKLRIRELAAHSNRLRLRFRGGLLRARRTKDAILWVAKLLGGNTNKSKVNRTKSESRRPNFVLFVVVLSFVGSAGSASWIIRRKRRVAEFMLSGTRLDFSRPTRDPKFCICSVR